MRGAFPTLQHYSPQQVELYVGNAVILDSAWPGFVTNPPALVLVYLACGTSDLSGRAHEIALSE